MNQDKKSEPARKPPAAEGPAQDASLEGFLARLDYDARRPQSVQEAAAVQAVQQFALEVDSEASLDAGGSGSALMICPACGGSNSRKNRFCASCGVPLLESSAAQPESAPATPASGQAAGEHHYHHHYHHHYFPNAEGVSPAGDGRAASTGTARDTTRARAPMAGASLSRAEAAVRKLTQDWVMACNNRQLDDLVELYATDALVLRSNFPPVRGAAAIREFFFAALDTGLGEVELEPLRVEVFGEVAYEAGRCKMLVPVAMGKRREERGKYLVMSARQSGEWKLVADCWSSDLSLRSGTEPEARSSPQQVASPLSRTPQHKPVK